MLRLNAYSEWDKIEFPNYKQDFSKWGLQFTLGKEKKYCTYTVNNYDDIKEVIIKQ